MAVLKSRLVWLFVVIAVLGTYAMWPRPARQTGNGAPMVQVRVPELTGLQRQGKQAFDENCASCHGADAAGQAGVAPPLIHRIYEPSHHGDAAIARAAKMGAPQHHWPFGNMPPVKGITDAEITVIIAYLRAVQRANGIY